MARDECLFFLSENLISSTKVIMAQFHLYQNSKRPKPEPALLCCRPSRSLYPTLASVYAQPGLSRLLTDPQTHTLLPSLPVLPIFLNFPCGFSSQLIPLTSQESLAPLLCAPSTQYVLHWKTSPYNGVSWLIVCLHHRLSFLPVHYFIPSV